MVCDTFDYDDYPVFVMPGEDAMQAYEKYNGKNMQKVMEVYNLNKEMVSQLDAYRSMNF